MSGVVSSQQVIGVIVDTPVVVAIHYQYNMERSARTLDMLREYSPKKLA
jgi:hypothetical protein